MRTVELVLDPLLDARVRHVWRRLHLLGLPSLATHTHPSNRPHLTLATAPELTPGVAQALADALPLRAALDHPVFFEGRAGALAWRAVADEALRDVQAAVWDALDGQERNPLHAPDRWVPHVSLALRVRPEQRTRAAALLADLGTARGEYAGARSYDSQTRSVVQLA